MPDSVITLCTAAVTGSLKTINMKPHHHQKGGSGTIILQDIMFNGKLKQSLAGGLSLTEDEPLN